MGILHNIFVKSLELYYKWFNNKSFNSKNKINKNREIPKHLKTYENLLGLNKGKLVNTKIY